MLSNKTPDLEDLQDLKKIVKTQSHQIQTLLRYCHGLEKRIGVLERSENCEQNSLPESDD